jgi:hypothetical protein
MTRTAWCVRCDGPQQCDERGCITCRVVDRKERIRHGASVKRIHASNKAAGVCITSKRHGAPLPGRTRCAKCAAVHARSA